MDAAEGRWEEGGGLVGDWKLMVSFGVGESCFSCLGSSVCVWVFFGWFEVKSCSCAAGFLAFHH